MTLVSWSTLLTAASGLRIHRETVLRAPSGWASDDRLRLGASMNPHTSRQTSITTSALPAGIVRGPFLTGVRDGAVGGGRVRVRGVGASLIQNWK